MIDDSISKIKIEKNKRQRKSIDEKIEELKEKLKKAENDKRNEIYKKGLNLWRKIKFIFIEDEDKLDKVLNDEDKLKILIKKIENNFNELFIEEEEKNED